MFFMCSFSVEKPQCAVNNHLVNEHKTLQVVCNVTYSGDWKPMFLCLQQQHQQALHHRTFNDTNTTYYVTNYTHSLNIKPEIYDEFLTCSVNFSHMTNSITCGVKQPVMHTYTWNSTKLVRNYVFTTTLGRLNAIRYVILRVLKVFRMRSQRTAAETHMLSGL